MTLRLMAFTEPCCEPTVKRLEGFRPFKSDLVQKGPYCSVQTFNLTFRFWRIRLREEETNPELRTGSPHPFGSILLTVVEVDRLGHAILLDGFAEGVFHNSLLKRVIESSMNHKARCIIDEYDKIGLFARAAGSNGEERTILDVALPQAVAMPPLKAASSCSTAGIHAHLP